jgi:hypothetical protein
MLINKTGERSQGKGNCTMAIVKLAKPAQDAASYPRKAA